MAKSKLRVVVIGCGAIAQRRHLPEYAGRNDVEVVAVVDIKRDRAKEIAAQHGVKKFFTDYRKALAMKPDLVSVCTPNALHAEHTIAALKGKAHVLCEKPMAGSLAEARRMVAAAKANRRQLMIGHNQRYAAAHVRGKQLFKSGLLGRCFGFRTTFSHAGPESWSVDGLDCFFFKKRLAVMGSMGDLGVHKTDFIRWFLDDEIVQVSAMMDRLDKKNCNVEDTAFVIFRMASGAIGQMHAGWIYKAGCDNSSEFYCEKGVLRLEADPNFPVVAELSNGEKYFIKTRAIQSNEKGGQYASGVIDAFVDAIQAGKAVPVPGQDVIHTIAAVVSMLESARTGRAVKVPKG